MADGTAAAPGGGVVTVPIDLLRELGDLKRIRSAGRAGSTAARLFARAWAALLRGEDARATALRTTAAALAASRLGDMDGDTLTDLGLKVTEGVAVLRRAVGELVTPLDPALAADLLEAAEPGAPDAGPTPPFVARLAAQPRAGVTCPGRPRLMLQPAETHDEHCLIVSVYGVLLAPGYGADPAEVFVASLAHHLHNAAMPDSGFTGEVLLGAELEPVIARARDAALGELDAPLAGQVRAALAPIASDATPAARAFHAADVLDRVLEIEQHLRPATVSMAQVLGPWALVHDGPVKPFHDRVLQEAGLL